MGQAGRGDGRPGQLMVAATRQTGQSVLRSAPNSPGPRFHPLRGVPLGRVGGKKPPRAA